MTEANLQSRNLEAIVASEPPDMRLATRPYVQRDTRRRIIWRIIGNSTEQNEQLGINNVQALFLDRFPEFDQIYPRVEDGVIDETKRESARDFIISQIGDKTNFYSIIGKASTKLPYFHGSHFTVIRKAFQPWGLTFEFIENPNTHKLYTQTKYAQVLRWAGLEPEERIKAIEQAARRFAGCGHRLSLKELRREGRFDLAKSIQKYYPGGLTALQNHLTPIQDNHPKRRRRKGYWTPETIQAEVLEFYRTEGQISWTLLLQKGRKDLCRALDRYPGGLTQVTTEIGIQLIPEQIATNNIGLSDLEEYEAKLLIGEKISFEEFIKRRSV